MQEKVIDGKAIAKSIKDEVAKEVENLKKQGVTPGLTAVLVGDDPASHIYVNNKAKACKKLGINGEVIKLPKETTSEELTKIVSELNARDDVHGILIQSPLPKQIDELDMILNVDPLKDVDGFHPMNVGYMMLGSPIFLPCTPFGIVRILDDIKVNPKGKKVVILGRGNIVGKPLAVMMMQKWEGCNATVTVCHTGTSDIVGEVRQADILVAAMGMPKFVSGDMLKEGVVVIDVGTNRVEDPGSPKGYYVCGDVDFDSCLKKASRITPVPGGVGPITIAMLMYNTVRAARLKLTHTK